MYVSHGKIDPNQRDPKADIRAQTCKGHIYNMIELGLTANELYVEELRSLRSVLEKFTLLIISLEIMNVMHSVKSKMFLNKNAHLLSHVTLGSDN